MDDDQLTRSTAGAILLALAALPPGHGRTVAQLAADVPATVDYTRVVLRAARARGLARSHWMPRPGAGVRTAAVWAATDAGRRVAAQIPPDTKPAAARRPNVSVKQRAELADRLADQYRAGATVKQLAGRHGYAYGTVRRALLEAGLLRGRGSAPAADPPDLVATLVAEYDAGANLRILADRYAQPYSRVRRIIHDAGCTIRQGGHQHQHGRGR